jgi:hypothetical protein
MKRGQDGENSQNLEDAIDISFYSILIYIYSSVYKPEPRVID